MSALFLHFGQNRHESGRKRTFGEQATQEIGDSECDPEGIGGGIGAKCRGNDNFPDQTQNPRYEGTPGKRDQGTQHTGTTHAATPCRRGKKPQGN